MNFKTFAGWQRRAVSSRRETVGSKAAWYLFVVAFMFLVMIFCGLCNESLSQQAGVGDDQGVNSSSVKRLRTVRVGYYPYEGFHMTGASGRRYGYSYDYLQRLRDYTNWKYEYSDSRHDWPKMLDMLRAGEIDLLPGVTKTSKREREFAFSDKPICQVSTLITVKAGNRRYRSGDYANWNGIRVGMLKNSTQNDTFARFAAEKNFSFLPVYYEKISYLTAALQEGKEIDATVTSSLRATLVNEWVCEQFNPAFMYIAVRKNDQELLKELNSGMKQLESFFPNFQKQLQKIYYKREKGGIVPFSRDETAFIADAKKSGKVFTVMLNPDRKPFSWLENGEYRGLFKEYVDEVSRRSGLEFRFVPVSTRLEYYAKRFSPDIDIVFDMVLDFRTAEDNGMKLSQPYFSASVSRLRSKQSGNVIKTISVLKNVYLEDKIHAFLPGDINVRVCNSLADLVQDVKSTASDAAYLYTRSAEYAVYEDTSSQLVSEYVPALETDVALGVREDLDPLLLSVLNRVILSLDDVFANKVRSLYTPQFKEVFTFQMFIHRHPFWAVGFPFVTLLLTCAFLTYLLVIRNRRRKELQLSVVKWDAASRIAKLYPFQMHVVTRQIQNPVEEMNEYWPVVNGAAVEPRYWVCPEDLPKVEKELNDFAQGLSEYFWMTYRVIQDDRVRYFSCYGVRDVADPDVMVGIVHDVTDTQEAEVQRNSVQRMWEKVVDNAPVMMFVKSEDDDFRYVQCNRDFAAFIGRTPDEVVGHTDAELFNRPQDALAFRDRDQQIMKNGVPQKFQESVENVNGQLRHIQTVKMPLKDANGQSLLIGMSTDVTDLQNSRDEAQKHEEMFRLTIQSIGDGVLITDENGCVQLLNPVAEHLIGLSTDAAKGKPHDEVFRVVSTLDDTPVVSPLKNVLDTGKVAEPGNHTVLVSFDGNRYHITESAGPICNLNGEIIGAVLTFRNVTEDYKFREELSASVTLWNVVADIAKLAPYCMRLSTRQVFGDVERLSQYWPVVDGKAIHPKEWVCPEDLEEGNSEFEKFVSGETDSFLVSFRAIRDGKLRYYRRYAVRDARDPDTMVGIIQDITLDKELERDRDASRALWEQVVNAMPILMFVKSADDDFRYCQCNQKFANMVGRRKSDIIGHTDMEIFSRARDKEHFRDCDKAVMEEGKVQEFYEEAQGANRYYHFQTVKMPFTDAEGKRLLIGLSVDISAYKKAEEERNAAQTLFNNAFAAMPIILYVKSIDNGFRYMQCNENFCKLFGKTENEILGRSDEEIFPKVDEAAVFFETDRQAAESGQPVEVIESLSGADNKTYHFRSVKMAALDVDGKPILLGMAVDITEMVMQREQIQTSRRQLQAGCLMTRSFTFELNEDGSISSTNGLYTELIPHVDGKPLPFEEWILLEDQQGPGVEFERFSQKKMDEITINFRTDWFGRRRYYKSILTREDSCIYGVTSDVTELLEASEKVKANSLMWKQVMDELPVRFFVKDADNDCRYIMCNKANARFLGLSEEQVLGKTTEEICKPSQAIAEYLANEQQILVDHKVSHTRVNIPDPNGVIREMEKIEMPIAGIEDRTLLVSIAFDITEREQSLRLAEISARILAGVASEPDFRKVLHHIGETTTNVLNCRRVFFAKCDDHGVLHYFLDTGIDPNYHIDQKSIASLEYYWNCYLDRLNRNELVMFECMGDDSTLEPMFEMFPEYRNMALVGTPVVVDGKLHGVMIISFNDPHVFTENDIRTLRAIGDCIALAENRSQQNEALVIAQQQQAYQLAERTALSDCLGIFMESDYMQIPFEQILETIRKQLGASHCYVFKTDAETQMATCLAEANVAGDHKFILGHLPFPFDVNADWYRELKEKSVVGWDNLSEDKERVRFDKSWLSIVDEHHIYSEWAAVIETNEEVWGVFGAVYEDSSTKPFNPKDESFVRSAARVVSMILARAQHSKDLMVALETQLNTAECLRYMVGDEDATASMRHLLDIIRKQTGAEIAFMVELNENVSNARSWGMLTIESASGECYTSKVSFGSDEEWYQLFKQDKPVYIPDTSKVTADDMLGSCAFLLHQSNGVRSYYEIPIYCGGKLWGAIGIMYTSAVTPLVHYNADFLMNAKKFFEILLARQESRKNLNNAVELAQAAEKAKSFFLASMSHEIRTPLNAVIGFTEMLKETEITDETQLEYIENIFTASNALLQLINDILDLSKLEAGQMQLVPERVDFPKYCQEIGRTFMYSAKQKQLQFKVDVPENIPPLMMDQIRMRQIFFNLIGNSVKFTPRGGSVTVSASFSQLTVTTGSLLLKFADTGIGMPEADQKKIFEPFVQLSKMRGTNASTTGTGLGLPIVRRLVDKMGGTLTVESSEGNGTTFFILLPNVDMAEEGYVPGTADSSTEESKGITLRASIVPPDQLHVLIVDDVPINLKIFGTLLKRFGVTYETASSGQEALEKLKSKRFNWVLTDMYMKGMSGVDLAKTVRENRDYISVRLAVVTADVDSVASDKKLFNAVLSKPVDRQQLYQCLFGGEQ